jgi:hypothetical protein
MEPQLSQLAVELPSVRFAEQSTALGQQINVGGDGGELGRRQLLQPASNLWLQLYATPSHSDNAIPGGRPLADFHSWRQETHADDASASTSAR